MLPPNNPSDDIARRQKAVYRNSAILSAILLFLWVPVLMQPPGTNCRPMGQASITLPILFVAVPVVFIQAVRQIFKTWPRKWPGLIAIIVSLIPLAVVIVLQWLILDVRGIIYEP